MKVFTATKYLGCEDEISVVLAKSLEEAEGIVFNADQNTQIDQYDIVEIAPIRGMYHIVTGYIC